MTAEPTPRHSLPWKIGPASATDEDGEPAIGIYDADGFLVADVWTGRRTGRAELIVRAVRLLDDTDPSKQRSFESVLKMLDEAENQRDRLAAALRPFADFTRVAGWTGTVWENAAPESFVQWSEEHQIGVTKADFERAEAALKEVEAQ